MKMIQLLALLSTFHLAIAFRSGHGVQRPLPSRRGLVAFSHCSSCVAAHQHRHVVPACNSRQPLSLILKSTENSNDTEETTESGTGRLQNRRRRRKQQQSALVNVVASQDEALDEDEDDEEDEEEEVRLSPSFDLKPRENAGVAFEVKDVRAVVGLMPQEYANTPEREGQRQSSFATKPGTTSFSSSSSPSLNTADSLERMLADARQMQLQEDESADDDEDVGEGVNIPTTIRSILSTIVTIDFFVIIGFLGWFLAGMFASSVLKNDDIQIAFNNNFSAIVQPALGILMVLSVASAIFKDPEEGEEQ